MFSGTQNGYDLRLSSLRVTVICAFTFAPCLLAVSQVPIAQPTVDRGTTSLSNEPQPHSSNETVTLAMVGQQANPGPGSVAGTALAENGSPLSAARVTLTVEGGQPPLRLYRR